MIANEIAAGRKFKENILYNLRGKADDPNPSKCAWYEARNLATDDLDAAAKIMQATASKSRATKPVFHFSIDWHKDEAAYLTKYEAIEAADKVVAKLGLQGHQALYFWHTDADHPHLHVVVNRVHDDKEKAWDLWKSKERLERHTQAVAQEMGFLQVPGRHNDLPFEPEKNKAASQNRADRGQGEELLPWSKEDVAALKGLIQPHFYAAETWQQLDEKLSTQGLQLRAKGQGLILTDGKMFTQLSKLGKAVRLKTLEERFKERWADHENRKERQVETGLKEPKSRDAEHDLDGGPTHGAGHINPMVSPSIDTRLTRLIEVNEAFKSFAKKGYAKEAERVMKAQEHCRRQDKFLTRAHELLAYHKGQLDTLLQQIYADPEQAKYQLEKLDKEGRLKAVLSQASKKKARWKLLVGFITRRRSVGVAKKRGLRLDKFRSRLRKQADKLEKRLFYRLQKIREAETRLLKRQQQYARAKAQAKAKEAKLEAKRQQEKTLIKDQEEALNQTDGTLIATAPIPWPIKRHLLNLHDQHRRKTPIDERDRARDRRHSKERE